MRSRGDGKLLLQVWRTAGRRHRRKNGEIIRSLYALRAGLSVISQKADEARPFEEKVKEREEKRTEIKFKIDDEQRKLDRANKDLSEIKGLKDEDDELRTRIDYFNKIDDKRAPIGCLFGTFLLAAIVGAFGFPISSCNDSHPATLIFGLILGVFAVLSIVFFVLSIKQDKKLDKLYGISDEIKKTNSKYLSEHLTKLKSEHEKAQKKIGTLPDVERAVKNWSDKVKTLQQKLEQIGDDVDDLVYIYRFSNEAKNIYNTLVKDFAAILDPREWENLDIIIYMLETRRANSMQDALNLTDLATRHEDIKSTLVTVGQQIQNSISTLAGRIGRLSYEIAESGRQTSAMLGNLNTSILNASEAERALLEKANTNSRQLMSDVGRLRHYAELDAREKGYTL